MPAVAIPAVIAAASAYSTGFLVLAAGTWAAIAAGATTLALGALSSALAPKPPKRDSSTLTNKPGTVAVRQSDMTRCYVYGHTRIVKGYAHITSTNSNKDLHLIYILCEGELRAINEIWVNDYAIPNDWLDADGNVTQGRYSGYMQIRKHLGSSTQAADSVAIANIPEWTTDHRLQGTAYLYVKMIKNQDAYPTGVPNLTAIVEGPALYDPRISTTRWSTNIPQFARDIITSTKGYQASTVDIDDTNIAAEMNIADEIVTVTDEPFTVASVATGTDLITLSGDLLTLQYGDQVQVSSSGSLPSGLSAATNYYVIPYQIKDTPRIRLATTLLNSMAGTYIDLTTDGSGTITVTKKGEPRYHGGGVVDSGVILNQTLNDMVSSMAGRAICIGGKWTLLSGAYRTPFTDTFTIHDMRGDGISWKNGLSMTDYFNIVKGTFRGAPTLYQDTDYPSAIYGTFIDNDLGVEYPKELKLPFTTRPSAAQRIAKIELFRAQQEIGIYATFSTKAMQVQPGDNIKLTVDRYGWVDKIFEVTSFDFNADPNGLICKLGLRETASAVFDWSAGEAITYDPAPNTVLTTPYDVPAPTGVSYNSTATTTTGGDTVYRLRLEWSIHPDGFVTEYGDFEVQYKLSADTDWLPSFFVDGEQTSTDVITASAGVYYDLRIRARNSIGVRSAWSTLTEVIIGSSGGAGFLLDWGSVADAVGSNNDYGSVADAVGAFNDWEFVV